mgnify:CR=1 FL=1
METFFLNLGLSFTLSKLLPYIIVAILGIAFGYTIIKKAKSLPLKIVGIVAIFIPFGIYFAINPIYQGDFSNDALVVPHSEKVKQFPGKKLVVVTIPGCQYCASSIESMKVLKNNKNTPIEYVVLSSDSSSLTTYKELIQNTFPLHLAEDPITLSELVGGRFPSYVLIEDKKPIKIWNNNNFGVSALDDVVNTLK